MSIGPATAVGDRRHRVQLQNPGPPVPNGDGSYTLAWTDLEPFAVWAAIEAAPQPQQERVSGGTTATTATHTVRIPFHPQVTERTRVLFNGRRFNVSAVTNPGEGTAESILVCEEMK